MSVKPCNTHSTGPSGNDPTAPYIPAVPLDFPADPSFRTCSTAVRRSRRKIATFGTILSVTHTWTEAGACSSFSDQPIPDMASWTR